MLALLAGAIAAVPAHADTTQTFTFLGYSTPGVIGQNVNISLDGGVKFAANFAGRYMGRFNTSSKAFNVFCADIAHTIDWGGMYTTLAVLGKTTTLPPYAWQSATGFYELTSGGAPGGVASAMTALDYKPFYGGAGPLTTAAARVQAAAWLGNTYLPAALTADQAAAVQIAMWDIIQDGGDGISAGSMWAKPYSGTAPFLSLVQGYINAAAAAPAGGDDTWFIQARRPQSPGSHYQDFIYYLPIPEPVFMQVGVLAALGLWRMRRAR